MPDDENLTAVDNITNIDFIIEALQRISKIELVDYYLVAVTDKLSKIKTL